MKKVIRDRDRGILLDAHWSESGLLIEPNGSKITSFIGALVRNAIPITCDEWRDEDLEEAKDKIWIEIQRSFNNMEDNRKQHCLRLAGRLLRGFRAFLTRKYLMDANKNFVDAEYPKRYKSLISPEEWVTFKAKRRDPKFQSRSKKNRQRASAPPYPYKKGRMGYGRLEQSILTRESSSETSVPPYGLWKEARVGKDGVVKEDVQKVFEKCETLSQSISPDEGNDCRSVLSRALDPISEVVYFLDSLHNPVSTYEAMKKLVDTIIQVFRAQRGSQVPKSKANNITWIQVECPGQRNEVDCGFYMLQFMKEVLLSNQIEIPSKYFDEFKCATYSKSKLDELKEEWCQFMIELKVV